MYKRSSNISRPHCPSVDSNSFGNQRSTAISVPYFREEKMFSSLQKALSSKAKKPQNVVSIVA
jgi:hypothetical protein